MRTLYWSLFLLLPNLCWSTGDSLRYLLPKDTLLLTVGSGDEKYVTHILEKKQTLYSLAAFYGLETSHLYASNPGLSASGPRVGSSILVPVCNKAIIRYKIKGFRRDQYAPILYQVKKGDTVYSIAKRMLNMPEDSVLTRIGIRSYNDLKPGQYVNIGWMSIQGIPDTICGEATQYTGPYGKAFDKLRENGKLLESKGAAIWVKDGDHSNYYALCDEVPSRSLVEVYNPLTKRTVHVKVMGQVPRTTYDENVIIVLSSKAAQTLGAIDKRFFVHIRHE